MSTGEERLRIAKSILDFEARRDAAGRLAVYQLHPDDGGGTYEVAGINDRYHPAEARALADLIAAGRHAEAETRAIEFMARFTDVVRPWSGVTAIESYLRDSAFNRGPKGAARILQRALGTDDDGRIGPITLRALAAAESDPVALLDGLRAARERYEREVVGRDETSRFWRGLVNRWNKARDFARTFLPS
jgi:lysozyme family protein